MSFVILLFTALSFADKPLITFEEASEQGFETQWKSLKQDDLQIPTPIEKIAWPFESFAPNVKMGNNFLQYQDYRPAGYHGGCDMILKQRSQVYAPVTGFIEAGHYSYTALPNGSDIKHWKPWPQTGDRMYFEIAVIDQSGFRYELHHINRASIRPEIKALLDAGGGIVEKGQPLAQVIDWGNNYDHIHLNVYAPNGFPLNPEMFFETLEDTIAPTVTLYALNAQNQAKQVHPAQSVGFEVKGFLISGFDKKNNNAYYQVFSYIELQVNGQKESALDFTKIYYDGSGVIDIRNVYPASTTLIGGGRLTQPTTYYPTRELTFHMKLPVTKTYVPGTAFQVLAKDMAGNTTTLNGVF